MANEYTRKTDDEVITLKNLSHLLDGETEAEVLASQKSKFAKYDFEKNEISITYAKKSDAESLYVKKTDKASTTAFGVVKVGVGLEINSDTGALDVTSAGKVKWSGVENRPFNSVNSEDFTISGTTDSDKVLNIDSTKWATAEALEEGLKLKLDESKFTAANIVSTLGTTPVNRATADASGNGIVATYETKADATAKLTEAKKYTDDKIGALDYTSKGADGSYVQKVSETDGVVSETIKEFDSTISAGSTSVNAPSSKAVEERIQEVIGGLDVAQVGATGKFIELVSEADGKVSATAQDFIDSITNNKDSLVAPTTKAIKQYVDDLVSAGVDIEVVNELPTASKDTKGKFYFVAHTHEGDKDIYDEYVTVVGGTSEEPTYSWEKIGNTDIDLSAYVKGSNLTTDKIVLGNGGVNVKASSFGITTTLGSDDTTIATSKAVRDALADYVLKTTTVNGHALSSNVTITKSDVELGNVENTGDSATPVANGTTKFTTGGAYTLKSNLEAAIAKKQDILTQGNGITISSNTVAVKLASGEQALEVSADGLSSVFSIEDITIG